MATGDTNGRAARTLLDELIRQRRQTLEEFADYAETFARDHGEPGTLSVRHLKRLIAGRCTNGAPISKPRPATARLLERIFNRSVDELLAPPTSDPATTDEDDELRARLRASARIDATTLDLFASQLNVTRRLDREFGAPLTYGEVCARIEHVDQLLRYSLTPAHRQRLAEHLAELCALAGWQALDMGQLTTAWLHHERGETAATESTNPEFRAHTSAERAFVLIDLGEPASATDLIQSVRTAHAPRSSRRMQAWLAAAHGEALAATEQATASLTAFDDAEALLPATSRGGDGAYVALDDIHLARWRGHALSRLDQPEAIQVLESALQELDSTFVRAETALRIDLAAAYTAAGRTVDAHQQLDSAEKRASALGSVRQAHRVSALRRRLLVE